MELSYFLAQLMGGSVALFALAGAVRPQLVMRAVREFNQSAFVTIIVSFAIITSGLAIVLTHNVWEMNWRVLVTIFGWGALLKGFMFIVSPSTLINASRGLMNTEQKMRWMMVLVFVLGTYMFYKGMGY